MYLVCPFKFIISKTNANCMRLGKHFGSPKEVSRLLFILGGGCPSSIMPQSSKELPYSHCPKKRVTKAVITRRKAITYSGRQITRSPLLVPYANPRPGSGSQRAEFMLTCLLWSAGIGYRTLKTLWNKDRKLLDKTKQGRGAKEAQINIQSPCSNTAGQEDMDVTRNS